MAIWIPFIARTMSKRPSLEDYKKFYKKIGRIITQSGEEISLKRTRFRKKKKFKEARQIRELRRKEGKMKQEMEMLIDSDNYKESLGSPTVI